MAHEYVRQSVKILMELYGRVVLVRLCVTIIAGNVVDSGNKIIKGIQQWGEDQLYRSIFNDQLDVIIQKCKGYTARKPNANTIG